MANVQRSFYYIVKEIISFSEPEGSILMSFFRSSLDVVRYVGDHFFPFSCILVAWGVKMALKSTTAATFNRRWLLTTSPVRSDPSHRNLVVLVIVAGRVLFVQFRLHSRVLFTTDRDKYQNSPLFTWKGFDTDHSISFHFGKKRKMCL